MFATILSDGFFQDFPAGLLSKLVSTLCASVEKMLNILTLGKAAIGSRDSIFQQIKPKLG
jgi:hypothetical protein